MSPRKLVPPKLEHGAEECSPKAFCAALKTMARKDNRAGLSIDLMFVSGKDEREDAPSRRMVLAASCRRNAKERALMLIFCPWCGKRIDFYRQEAKT